MPISDKFNTLRFINDSTTDQDKYSQHFLALMMIHNASDVELCQLFPSSLQDFTLFWLVSLASRSISRFQELGQKFRHYFIAEQKIIPTSDHLLIIRQ